MAYQYRGMKDVIPFNTTLLIVDRERKSGISGLTSIHPQMKRIQYPLLHRLPEKLLNGLLVIV